MVNAFSFPSVNGKPVILSLNKMTADTIAFLQPFFYPDIAGSCQIHYLFFLVALFFYNINEPDIGFNERISGIISALNVPPLLRPCYLRLLPSLMAKTANLYARIEPDVKEQAESILTALGIPASNAINMFYKQIILQRGLPFEVKMPAVRPLDANLLTDAQMDAELETGYTDMQAGRTKSVKSAFADIRKDYGL